MSNSSENNALITENIGLVHSCAIRFKGRGVEYEDLFQAGCVGLIKAAAGFDPDKGFRFSTYAVPAILGEIRRIFRDGGSVKIGRAAKEKARQLLSIKEELTAKTGREPTATEIAQAANMDTAETAALLSACLPVISLTAGEDENQTDIPVPPPDEKLSERLDLRNAIHSLDENEQKIIDMRYFRGMTQTVTARQLGLSQVQVSRKEKAILTKLRKMLA
ncbi:MAG: sigma-70 family RNA polymerase sigma factor [Ruminococcaceae bacterium]|nr:sigma-70 family RNA polymerase sigma factor [Oscillospiraceae bacterium]MBR3596908.1 sigma-70 family RNA polymerase sigma factor [Clostridia bacterium]